MSRVPALAAAALAAAAALSAPAAVADGISLEPGEWRIEQVTRMPIQAEPQMQVSETCLTDSDFTPDQLVTDEHGACEFSDVRVEGDTMTWSFACPDAQSSGTGEFTASGQTGSGHMVMSMEFQGQDMSFTVEWEAERIGSCS